MISSFSHWTSYVNPRVDHALSVLLFFVLSFAAAPTSAQVPSNVYRPPTDNFNQGQPAQGRRIFRQNQGGQPVIQNFQQGQTFQSVPQYQTVPSTPQFTYPQQFQTPIYQQPIQEVPGQVVTQQPAQNDAENVELKRSLVKARDLMQKYQLKLEDVTRRNQELESEITNLQQSGDMSDNSSQELEAAKAAATEAQRQMAGLQQQVVSLQKAAQMAAGSDEQVAELTRNIQQFKTQNDELNGTVTTLQNALREKETQIASMGSNEDSKLADLRGLLEESETTNKQLSMRLETAEAKASEMAAPQENPELDQLRADNQQLSMRLKTAEAKASEMAAPQENPELDQLRADNQQLGQQKQQLESENSQLNDMLGKLQSENSELDATVTRLSNMPAPVEAQTFVATPSATPDLTGLHNQLASVTRRNEQLKRQLKFSKSKYASLTDENARLMEDADSKIEVAAAPVAVMPIEPVVPVAVAVPELGLDSVSAGWPVKYWIFGMLGVGLAVGLGVAWYESVVGPSGLRGSTRVASNRDTYNPGRPNPGTQNPGGHNPGNPGTSNQ